MNLPATRPLRRLLFVLLFIFGFVVLSFLLEPRRHSLTCRSFWSCVTPFHRRHPVQTVPDDEQISVTETTLSDGTVKFSRKLKTHVPTTLFLVLTRDGHSWSRDFQSTRRSVYDFLDLLASTGLEPDSIALGLSTEDKHEYDLLRKATDEIPLGRVSILWRNGTQDENGVGADDGGSEHQNKAMMARQRNYLMSRSLVDEKHVVWVDAGIVEFSKGLVQTMMAQADARGDVGVITARCERDDLQNYDTDAWALNPQSVLLSSDINQVNQKDMVDELTKSQSSIANLINGTVDSDLVRLDSVGGTIVYMKADLIRQGLMFPWWRVVGTSWRSDGWVGLDTEGLCYISNRLPGGACFALGGTHKVRHADWG